MMKSVKHSRPNCSPPSSREARAVSFGQEPVQRGAALAEEAEQRLLHEALIVDPVGMRYSTRGLSRRYGSILWATAR